MNSENWEKVEESEVIKLEKEGQELIGTFVSIKESVMYPNSYFLRLENDLGTFGTFVNTIMLDKINTKNISVGDKIKIVYLGKKKAQNGKNSYHDYDLFVSRK